MLSSFGKWRIGGTPGVLVPVSLLLLALLAGALQADWDFTLISRRAESLYGPLGDGKQRIDDWQRLLASQVGASEAEQLKEINRFFNAKLRFTDDLALWNQVDYWATPVEALRRGAGDCEDYAIAKYFSLISLGVSPAKMRMVYVRAQLGGGVQAHMVLAYYPEPTAEPLILDNLITDIRPASRRPDLAPVFSFNAEGLWQGVGGSSAGDPVARLSRWREILSKAKAEGWW